MQLTNFSKKSNVTNVTVLRYTISYPISFQLVNQALLPFFTVMKLILIFQVNIIQLNLFTCPGTESDLQCHIVKLITFLTLHSQKVRRKLFANQQTATPNTSRSGIIFSQTNSNTVSYLEFIHTPCFWLYHNRYKWILHQVLQNNLTIQYFVIPGAQKLVLGLSCHNVNQLIKTLHCTAQKCALGFQQSLPLYYIFLETKILRPHHIHRMSKCVSILPHLHFTKLVYRHFDSNRSEARWCRGQFARSLNTLTDSVPAGLQYVPFLTWLYLKPSINDKG